MIIKNEYYRELSRDPVLKDIFTRTTAKSNITSNGVYPDLLRTIVYQQLATKAADSIYRQFLGLFDGISPEPQELIDKPDEILRTAGLSGSKIKYLKNIAIYFISEPDLPWYDMDVAEITKRLISIKGVGQWTVNIILMFTLDQLDIFPINDLAIRRAMMELYGLEEKPKKVLYAELEGIADHWKPYRTVACLHLWDHYVRTRAKKK